MKFHFFGSTKKICLSHFFHKYLTIIWWKGENIKSLTLTFDEHLKIIEIHKKMYWSSSSLILFTFWGQQNNNQTQESKVVGETNISHKRKVREREAITKAYTLPPSSLHYLPSVSNYLAFFLLLRRLSFFQIHLEKKLVQHFVSVFVFL